MPNVPQGIRGQAKCGIYKREILSSHKKKHSANTCYSMDEPKNKLSESSKTQSDVLYDSIYLKYPEQVNPWSQKTDR